MDSIWPIRGGFMESARINTKNYQGGKRTPLKIKVPKPT